RAHSPHGLALVRLPHVERPARRPQPRRAALLFRREKIRQRCGCERRDPRPAIGFAEERGGPSRGVIARERLGFENGRLQAAAQIRRQRGSADSAPDNDDIIRLSHALRSPLPPVLREYGPAWRPARRSYPSATRAARRESLPPCTLASAMPRGAPPPGQPPVPAPPAA